mgnify:CR=1 FL=1
MSFSQLWSILFIHLSGTLFIQVWSVFTHLRVIYTMVVDFYTLKGSFIHCGILYIRGSNTHHYIYIESKILSESDTQY